MAEALTSCLLVDVHVGELLNIHSSGHVSIELVHKSGRLARLRVVAPVDAQIEKGSHFRTQHGEMSG